MTERINDGALPVDGQGNQNTASTVDHSTTSPGADFYAERGLQVFPVHSIVDGECTCDGWRRKKGIDACTNAGKHPRFKSSFKDATNDPARIANWRDSYPNSNIGIATGEASGIVVLDVDGETGAKSFATLEHNHGELPDTWSASSGSGGEHYYFKHPGVEVKNSAGKVAPGLDIRGDGGYIIAPPSKHRSGGTYEWHPGRAPGECELAELPEWLLKLLTIETKPGRSRSPTVDLHGRGPISEGERNDTLFRLACRKRRDGADENEILEYLGELNEERCDPPIEDEELERIAESAAKYETGAERESRPTIYISEGELPRMTDEAEKAVLADGSEQVFQRGSQVVRLVRSNDLEVRDRTTRPVRYLSSYPLTRPYTVELFTRVADWRRYDARSKKDVRKDCPSKVAETYLARGGSWKVPVLRAIVQAPTLRPEGSVLQTPGYDVSTGVFFDPSGCEIERIPEKPSKAEAEVAIGELETLLKDFPYVDDSDRSAALAAILTVLSRTAYAKAPMFTFSAPTPGTGKSLHADITALLATGRKAPAMSQGTDAEEEQKRVFALLLECASIALIDNVERDLSGDTLCSVLTQENFKGRILGKSRTSKVPTTGTTWFATGNNLVIRGDLKRRVVPCFLDAREERPERRTFDRDLYTFVPANRGRFVRAALTVLRAYEVAGRPRQNLPPFGNFEEWSGLVRSAIVWLGRADPLKGRAKLEQSDPETRCLQRFLSVWVAQLGKSKFTAAEVMARARDSSELLSALEEIPRRSGVLDAARLGRYLSQYRDRLCDGMSIERIGERSGSAEWRVVGAPPSEEERNYDDIP